MLEASDSNPIASMCRGTVICPENKVTDENQVVGAFGYMARPMDRFFNYGQEASAKINFNSKDIKIFEKLDGTCCIVYFDFVKNEWCVGTRSVPDADIPLDDVLKLTFRDLFEKALFESTKLSFEKWVIDLNKNYTYICELCTPDNQIVVRYDDYKVFLLAVRNTQSGQEYPINIFNLTIPNCPNYNLSNLNDILSFVSSVNPLEHEGVVVLDEKSFGRIKVKSPSYLALNKIRDTILKSNRGLLEICLLGRLDDAMPALSPVMVSRALEMKERLVEAFRGFNSQYNTVINMANDLTENGETNHRKAVALSAQKIKAYMPYIMARYMNKCSSFEEYCNQQINEKTNEFSKSFLDTLLELMNYK
jgi:RNA ligase